MILKFTVTGMTCAACSARVEKVSRQVPGVETAEVNLLAETMAVTHRYHKGGAGSRLQRCTEERKVTKA